MVFLFRLTINATTTAISPTIIAADIDATIITVSKNSKEKRGKIGKRRKREKKEENREMLRLYHDKCPLHE